jgi:pimeloyl-ACP methyl ester carboxylesterase
MSPAGLPHLRQGKGAPLVVLPGLSGSLGSPARLKKWLQRLEIADLSGSRSVWSIERPSGLEPGISIADLAAEYAATIRMLFDEPVDVVGISTGGSIALQLAADYPELVQRLVLVSSAHRLSDHGRQTQRTIATLLRENHPRRAASLFLATTASSWFEHSLLAVAGLLAPRAIVGHQDPDLLAILDAEDSFDLESRLGGITVPTLITGGANDRYYSAELFGSTSRGLQHSSLTVYPGAGHIGTHGNPRLVKDILRFLELPEAA